jgi:ABC-type transport system involved in Fe-S cluster assembly fused permease/ATPase subunit
MMRLLTILLAIWCFACFTVPVLIWAGRFACHLIKDAFRRT